MTIEQIKQKLTLATVLNYYSLKPDKNLRLNCPFHEDKTPSLQVYYKTHTAYCFSSNCKTHGKSLDVIDFIMHKENSTKAEAINKAVELLGNRQEATGNSLKENISREQFLGNMYQYFKNAISNSKPAQEYLQSRGLDPKKIEVGYNGGQFHHGSRRDEQLIKQCLEYGLLIDKGLISRTGQKAYAPFGKWSICFALKNKENQITSLYFRSILDEKKSKHFYLKNRSGLYPNYPKPNTQHLILTESIIDAASVIQALGNSQKALVYSVIACYGTNGLNEEIQKTILELTELEEIIFAFDNDEAGKEAVKKYEEQFKQYKISTIELPNKDINETLQLHEPEIFVELLEKRKAIVDFSIEDNSETKTTKKQLVKPNLENAIEFLKQKNLLENLNKQIGKSGIVGEENSRLLLFLIIISYMNKSPIHAIVQGSSGSGKTHIISRIADLMPQEDVLRFTRITESSLYNWGEFDLFRKIIIIEDLDGLKEDALYALRELISNQFLSSSVSIKDKKGNNKSTRKEVKGQFSSLSATTKGETYEDNMNRSFVLAVDESEAQTQRIIDYQNKRITGEIDPKESQKAVSFIQQIVRNLKYYEVQNQYATQLQLPDNVRNKRRLNEMIQSVIKQITIVNQYQRRASAGNQLITEIEDIENAIEILFESIILKLDELDGSSRQFFEKLKKAFGEKDFTRFEAMEKTGFKKTQLQFYLNDLVRLEYLKQFGHHNKGYKYKVSYLDNNQQVRKELKAHFVQQLEDIKTNTSER